MKAVDLFYKKIIFNDLLAIALAGIISLLFAQTSSVFLNSSFKKQEYRSAQTDYLVDDNGLDQCFLTQAEYDLCSPAEEINLVQVYAGVSERPVLRFSFEASIHQLVNSDRIIFYLSKRFQATLPSAAFPSIPIAFRKLLI